MSKGGILRVFYRGEKKSRKRERERERLEILRGRGKADHEE